jgi:hypothetical protein
MRTHRFNYWILILTAFLTQFLLLATIQVNAIPLLQKPILIDSNFNNNDLYLEKMAGQRQKSREQHIKTNQFLFLSEQ